MAKIKERERAIQLRKQGKSIKEIAREVGVSQGTVSHWCREITLDKSQIEFLKTHQKKASIAALLRFAETQRTARQQKTAIVAQKGRRDVGVLTKRDRFMVILGLYWGEGYKKGNDEFGFTNSDPTMIQFLVEWLEKECHISRDRLILRVSINAIHKKRIEEVTQFWSELLKVSQNQFTKPSLIKTKNQKEYSNKREHFGTLRVKVRGGTNLRRRVLGSLEAVTGNVFLH